MSTNPEWIAVDWGASGLRAWAVGADNEVLAQVDGKQNSENPDQAGFETTLLDLISDWLPAEQATPVVCCGMAGFKSPWRSAPCVPVDPQRLVRVPTKDARLHVHVIPGIMQQKPRDMMHGPETLIAGFLALQPAFDGVICLPGVHSRWVHISAGEIVSFATYLTGELFSLMAEQSSLRQSIAANGWDDEAFDLALATALSHPALVSTKLYSLHVSVLSGDINPISARSALSGFLIGQELGAARPYWLGQNVVVAGMGKQADVYAAALGAQGVVVERLASDTLTLTGLMAAYESDGAT